MKFIVIGLRKGRKGMPHINSIINYTEYILGTAETIIQLEIKKDKIIYIDIPNHKSLPEKFPLYITDDVYIEPVLENSIWSPIHDIVSNRNSPVIFENEKIELQPHYGMKRVQCKTALTPNAPEYVPIHKRDFSALIPTTNNNVPVSPLIHYLIELRDNLDENREIIAELEVDMLLND